MSVKLCILSFLLITVLAHSYAGIITNEVTSGSNFYMISGIKVYSIDRQCALVGGLCVHTSDCSEPTGTKGLCPSSAHLGVECCYELPVRPASCEQHLGECMNRCNKMLVRPATDCENGQVCCVLV